MDHLHARFGKNISIDVGDTDASDWKLHSVLVVSTGKTLLGTIVNLEPLSNQSVAWEFRDSKNPSDNFSPVRLNDFQEG